MFRLTHLALPGLLFALLLVPLTGFTGTKSNTSATTDTSLLRFTDKLYAINLVTSEISVPTAVMRQAYPELIVYQTHVSVAGTRQHYLRLGFFATKEEARATLATVRSWYPDAWLLQITPLEQTSALGVDLEALAQSVARTKPASAPPSAPQPVAKPPAGYALHLDVTSSPPLTTPALPPALTGYRLYVQRVTGAKGAEFHLNLGVFADRKGAEQARDKLLANYPQAAVREITAGEKAQVAALAAQPAPVVAAKPVAPGVTATLPTPGVAAKPAAPSLAATAAAVAAKPAPSVAATQTVPDVTVKPAAPVVATKPAPVAAVKPAVIEVVAKPVAPDATVKPEAARPAPSLVTKPAASGVGDAEQRARSLLDTAQDQIIARQYDAAVKTLGEILTLPKNIHTADAIEYTGLAYDQAGKVQLAIQHYQKFLSLYPDSRSVNRIRQRLQTLQKGAQPTAAVAP